MLETQPFDARVRLPQPLAHLRDLALNLRWTWDRETRALFQEIYPELWNSHIYNPWLVLPRDVDQAPGGDGGGRQFPGARRARL